ncbi:disease resistance protein, partial [Striga asiatica]
MGEKFKPHYRMRSYITSLSLKFDSSGNRQQNFAVLLAAASSCGSADEPKSWSQLLRYDSANQAQLSRLVWANEPVAQSLSGPYVPESLGPVLFWPDIRCWAIFRTFNAASLARPITNRAMHRKSSVQFWVLVRVWVHRIVEIEDAWQMSEHE